LPEIKDKYLPVEPPGLRRRCWIIFITTIILFLIPLPPGFSDPNTAPSQQGHYLLTKSRAGSWNDQARIATVESLGERGTMAIDHSKWGWFTGDKVLLREHFYSTKPPLLSAAGAMSYMALRTVVKAVTGREITYLHNEDVIYPWVTLTTSGLAFALLLVYFFRALYLVDISSTARWWLFWSLAIGSLYPAYSTVFNNHSIAGSALFIAFYYVIRYRTGRRINLWEMCIAGIAIGFASVTDFTGALPFLPLFFALIVLHDFSDSGIRKLIPVKGGIAISVIAFITVLSLVSIKIGPSGTAILVFVPSGIMLLAALYLASRKKFFAIVYLIAAIIPVIAHLFLNSRVTGNWMPTYIQSDVYITTPPGYFGEVLSPEESTLASLKKWIYIGEGLFGIRGIFSYTPAILMGFVACFYAVSTKFEKLRLDSIAVLLGVLAGWGWLLVSATPNFGGTSYGFRYALPATPLFLFFCHRYFIDNTKPVWRTVFRNAVFWGAIVALVAIPYPWGIFSPYLPSTQFSFIQNLQHIALFTASGF
jgi:hypothetical protein